MVWAYISTFITCPDVHTLSPRVLIYDARQDTTRDCSSRAKCCNELGLGRCTGAIALFTKTE